MSGAVALLLGAAMTAAPADHSVNVAGPGEEAYTLQESADGRSLVLRWNGGEEVIGSCSERLLQWLDLRREGLSASVIERNCGATVDYATQVVIDGREGRQIVAVFQGRPRVTLAWDAGRLQVNRSWLPAQKVFLQQTRVTGFGVDHAVLGPAARATSQSALDDSNRGWGAHGRSVGLPDEVLLRWAGWSQQASGMYRPEWGSWQGTAPYGDDPGGSARIREGMGDYADNGERPG